jgi:hypothetical protein
VTVTVVSDSINNNFQVLTGGEYAYFIAFQDWLGIADGVGQWLIDNSHSKQVIFLIF